MLEVDGFKREELDAVIEKTMREQEETQLRACGSGWDVCSGWEQLCVGKSSLFLVTKDFCWTRMVWR